VRQWEKNATEGVDAKRKTRLTEHNKLKENQQMIGAQLVVLCAQYSQEKINALPAIIQEQIKVSKIKGTLEKDRSIQQKEDKEAECRLK